MSTTRTEHDLLGSREVPDDRCWGIHTLRAVENFPISGTPVGALPALVRGMAQVKKAAALANERLGAVPPDVAQDVVAACDRLLAEEGLLAQFPVDVLQGGAGTSVNMNVNEVLANLALDRRGVPRGRYDVVDPHAHVNASQSTNDAYATGLRLGAYAAVAELRDELRLLATALDVRAREFAAVLKMGRTQLQEAVPMTVGQELAAFAVLMREEVTHLATQTRLLLEVNLGGTAIGTGVNTPPGYRDVVVPLLAEVTGLPVVPAANPIEATSDTGAIVAVHSALKRLALKLGKICNDLRLLSSGPRAGLGELALPALQAGSSIMPGKVNPVIPEVVNQVCFKVRGNDLTVEAAADAAQLQLNVMEPVMAQCLFESVRLLGAGLRVLRERCIAGLEVHEDVCRAGVLGSPGLVTLLTPVIGHAAGDRVAAASAAAGRPVRDVVLELGLMDADAVDALLAPERLLDLAHAVRACGDRPAAAAGRTTGAVAEGVAR